MPLTHWNDGSERTERYYTAILGGKRLPGIVTVDVQLPSGLDIRKRRGKRGGFVKDEGDPPRKLKFRIRSDGSQADLLLLDDFRDLLIAATVSGARDPLALEHEWANFWGIHTVILGDADLPMPEDLLDFTFDAVEYLPESADNAQADVNKQKAKAKAEEDAWSQFRDDGVAGSGAPPAAANAAHDNLPDPRAG
jgi:hypothetical protein